MCFIWMLLFTGKVKGLSISRSDEIRIKAGIKREIEEFRPIVTSDLWRYVSQHENDIV